jgi:hypothetical protein
MVVPIAVEYFSPLFSIQSSIVIDQVAAYSDRPYILRPSIALLNANESAPYTLSQEAQSNRSTKNAGAVAKRLIESGRAWRTQMEVAGIALMYRIAAVGCSLSQFIKFRLPW